MIILSFIVEVVETVIGLLPEVEVVAVEVVLVGRFIGCVLLVVGVVLLLVGGVLLVVGVELLFVGGGLVAGVFLLVIFCWWSCSSD